MGVGMHEFQGESGRNAEERRLKRKEAMAGVMIRRDRGKWKRERERERERKGEGEKGRAEEKTGEEGRWYNLVGSNAGYSAPRMQ